MARLILVFLLTIASAQAKVMDAIPTSLVRVTHSYSGPNPRASLSSAQVYIDGPVLLWRGTWRDPHSKSPIPELLVPVRVILPGAHKFIDIESVDSVTGEITPEAYSPEGRIYRVLVPIRGPHETHHYEAVFHSNLRSPFDINVDLKITQATVIRTAECARLGILLDSDAPNLVFLSCAKRTDGVHVAIYAPMDKKWTKFGRDAERVYDGRGIYFKLPLAVRGQREIDTVTEFELENRASRIGSYTLLYRPNYEPNIFTSSVALGPAFHHYRETFSGLSVDELTLFARLSGQLKVLPIRGFDIYGDVGGTAATLMTTSSVVNTPGFKYLTLNFRAGYVNPVGPGTPQDSLMAGYYYYHLSTPNGRYGLASELSGPQIFYQHRFQPVSGPVWWWNARWAFLNGVTNFEGTFSYGREIFWIGTRRPLSAVAELSWLQFTKDASTMSTINLVLGLSYLLY